MDDFSVKIDYSALTEKFNRLSNSLRKEKIQKLIEDIVKPIYEQTLSNLRKGVKSASAYSDLMKGTNKKGEKVTKNKGVYFNESFTGAGVAMSISQKYADYRLHWLDSGTTERYKKDGSSTGTVTGIDFFSETVSQNIEKKIEEEMYKLLQSL